MTAPPRLLHQRVYLVAYDLSKSALYDRPRVAFLTRAAVLTELGLGGWVTAVDGTARPARSGLTGDVALDEALSQIAARRRGWKSWLRHDYKRTLETTEQQLRAAGLVSIDEQRTFGIVTRRRVDVTDAELVGQLQAEALEVLHGSRPATSVDLRDAALVVLAAAGRAPGFSRRETHRYSNRVDQLTGRVSDAVPGLDAALKAIRITLIAAQGGIGGN